MITDEERREVARRLRDEADGGEMHIRDFLGSLCVCIRQERNGYRALHRLADLIEPVERMCLYYDAYTNHCGCYDTRLIDRDALLALANEIDRKSNDGAVNPDPMRPLATSLELFGYARRIREACGEAGR